MQQIQIKTNITIVKINELMMIHKRDDSSNIFFSSLSILLHFLSYISELFYPDKLLLISLHCGSYYVTLESILYYFSRAIFNVLLKGAIPIYK
jgi:hypothetical protein